MLKAIHAQEDREAALAKAAQVAEKLSGLRLGPAAELVRAGVAEMLSYTAFPREHWTRLRTNNALERLMRDVRRRTRVVGAFPDGRAGFPLLRARVLPAA
jgi:putative transposase